RGGDPLFLREGVEPDLAQEQGRVLRRRRVRDQQAGILDRDDEPQRVGICGEVTRLDETHHHLLLALGVLDGALPGVGHLEIIQRGAGAAHPRLPRHVLLVNVGRERVRRPRGAVADGAPVRLHQLAQRLAPRLLVRRVDQHPVDVENCSPELRHAPSCQSWAGGLAVAGSRLTSNTAWSPGRSSRTSPRTATLTGRLTPSGWMASVSRSPVSVTWIGVCWTCTENERLSSRPGSRGSRYRTSSRMWVPV